MENLMRVKVMHPTNNNTVDVDIPDDMTVQDIIEELIESDFIERAQQGYQAVSYTHLAAGDLKIKEITADGQALTIVTTEPVPALMNYLSDPYGCIIDMEAGITDDGNVSGTGPYMATKVETDKGLTLVKNENYWGGMPKLDTICLLYTSIHHHGP